MDDTEFIEEFMKIMRTVHSIAFPKSISRETSLTPLQLEVLAYLHLHKKTTVSALGRYLLLSSSAIAQLTDRLVKTGFIKRENNPNDRRSVLLSLTPKGVKVFSQLHKVHQKKMKELASLMPEKDVKELVRIFKNLHQKSEDRKNA